MTVRQEDGDNMTLPWLNSYDKGVPPGINYPGTTLQALLDETSDRYPDHTAIIFMGKKITYHELRRLVNRFAASLRRLGVSKGDKVVLFLPNSPQFVIAYYGILKAGAVVVPANPLYVDRELLHLLEDSGARTVITLDLKALFGKVNSVKQRAGLQHIIISGLQEFLPFPKNILFPIVKHKEIASPAGNSIIRMRDLLTEETRVDAVEPEVRHDDVAVTLYTGGTTGVPKGVCLTHDNLIANLLQCHHWMPDVSHGNEVFLTVLPVFHAFSMTTSMNWPVYVGGTMILLPRFEAASLLEALNKHRPTLLMGVPAVFHTIIHYPELHRYDLSSLRFCFSGADTLPAAVQQEFEHLTGCKLVEGYGLTETSPVVTCNPVYGKRKGIGLPLPDTTCRIVDMDNGAPLQSGQDGELVVRGPQVMREYCHNPEETAKILKDGCLYTGDIARMDEDGYFEFIGRKKDMIKVQRTDYITAYKVYPADVEEILLKHDKVLEAAVIGVPDAVQGERIAAYVILRPGADTTAGELVSFCRQYLAEYKVPSQIEFINVLPKNMLGKVLRNELRQRAS
ncbi:MAG: long-chain fatty acid--CoA ligase [Dehalococcoidales bacterium]|nr:long-chain fatty acid--CoA ligase [Dehalococcoidales bacterium]